MILSSNPVKSLRVLNECLFSFYSVKIYLEIMERPNQKQKFTIVVCYEHFVCGSIYQINESSRSEITEKAVPSREL